MWNDSRADSVEYLELCDKYSIGWLRKQASGRAQNPLAGLAAFDANGSRSETMASKVLLLLLTKVTKHILPQTSPVGSSLAGI